MYGSDDLYSALNISAVTTGLDDYVIGEVTHKALFFGNVLPTDFSGDKAINFYMSTMYNAALEYGDYRYTVNCRAKSYNESLTIAKSVIDNINRVNENDSFFICFLLATVPPIDETDNFNTPVEVRIQEK